MTFKHVVVGFVVGMGVGLGAAALAQDAVVSGVAPLVDQHGNVFARLREPYETRLVERVAEACRR